jgi:hypothetical protein
VQESKMLEARSAYELGPEDNRREVRRLKNLCLGFLAGAGLLLSLLWQLPPDRPVDYATDVEHFYYGSIGSDIAGGLPLKVVQVLPAVFPEYLPKRSGKGDYREFGFIQQPGHAMPIGFSVRRRFIDFTAINCAVCHTGSVRSAALEAPTIIPAMPANTVDLIAFFNFLFRCAGDERFNAERLVSAMKEAHIDAPLDGLVYRFVVPQMQEALLARAERLHFLFDPAYPPVGPGRVNTFDTFKFEQFAPYYRAHGVVPGPDELFGTVDFPAVWNQAAREGLDLHWDGNNTSVRERNFSASLGAGAEPPTVDVERVFRVEAWLRRLPAPTYPFAIDAALAQRGAGIFRAKCFSCHDFGGDNVGKVVALENVGTDRARLDSYTQFLLDAQKDYTKGYFWAFSHFTKTHGYASQPLDGIWARAPFLHNGSVPSMWDLLSPEEKRPEVFTVGGDVYDSRHMGFEHQLLSGTQETGYRTKDGEVYTASAPVFDTKLRGNGRQGHSGPEYGTDLSDTDKRALIEYLEQYGTSGSTVAATSPARTPDMLARRMR